MLKIRSVIFGMAVTRLSTKLWNISGILVFLEQHYVMHRSIIIVER